jgi:hypothetical protein
VLYDRKHADLSRVQSPRGFQVLKSHPQMHDLIAVGRLGEHDGANPWADSGFKIFVNPLWIIVDPDDRWNAMGGKVGQGRL